MAEKNIARSYGVVWRLTNLEERRAYDRNRYATDSSKKQAADLRWRLTHPGWKINWELKHPGYHKNWRLSNPESVQVSQKRHDAKRRELGWKPLNSRFSNSDGHHLSDGETVIYIPHWMHKGRGKCHNHYTGKGMVEMDALAGAFFTEDWT